MQSYSGLIDQVSFHKISDKVQSFESIHFYLTVLLFFFVLIVILYSVEVFV